MGLFRLQIPFMLFFLCTNICAQTNMAEFPSDRTEVVVHLIRAGNHLLMPVRINNQDPALFLLDTGASRITVDREFARAANLEVLGDGPASNGIHVDLCALPEMEVAGFKLRNEFAFETDLTRMREESGMKQLRGVIGGNFLKSVPFAINWARATLTLYKEIAVPGDGALRVPLWLVNDMPMVQASPGSGTPGWFIIDTGSDGGFQLAAPYARWNLSWLDKQLSWRWINFMISGPKEIRFIKMGNADLAGVPVGSCKLVYPSQLDAADDIVPPSSGLVGQEILRNLELTFDYKQAAVWIKHDSNNGVPAEWTDPNFDAHSADAAGMTPLMRAAQMGRIEDAQRFLGAGPGVDATDASGATALHYAGEAQGVRIAQMLISAGAPVDIASRFGSTPLLSACHYGNVSVVKLLLEHGAKADASDSTGITPLMFAAEDGNPELLTTLIKAGADLNAISPAWGSALNIAAVSGRTEAAKLLLDSGADVNRLQRYKTPLLAQAAFGGSTELVKVLLDRGMDPNVPNADGQTALFGAALKGHAEIVQLLLDRGADSTIRDARNNTAITFAVSAGHLDCASMIYSRHPLPTSKSTMDNK